MNLKTKIEDWYDDLIYNIHHTKWSVKAFFKFLGRWFSYCRVLRTAYDFDYASILDVERHQITRVRDTIAKYQSHVNWKRDVYWMNMALKLLDIIEEGGGAKLIGKGFNTEPCGNGFHKLVEDPDSKWVLPIYVNVTNSQRFTSIEKEKFEDPKIGPLMKGHLREEKAWYLYHKLRTYKMRSWWD